MNEQNKKVPTVRFKGFTNDWEQRKLGELVTSYDTKRMPIRSEERMAGPYPYYGATGIIDYVNNYIFDGKYLLLAEDGANIIDRTAPITYLTNGKFWLNNHAHIMNSTKSNLVFLKATLDRKNYIKFNTGTAQPKLNAKIVANLKLNLPVLAEQDKISKVISRIEIMIALQQRKLEQLKQLKKAMLQQLFVDKNSKQPNLRFKNFNGEWEQHKLGEVCEKTYSGLTGKNKQDFGHGKAKYITYLNVHDNAIATTKGVDQVEIDPKQNEVVKGDLLFTVSSEVPEEVALNSVWPGTDNNVYLNSFCFGMRPMSKSVNSFFLTYYLRSPQMRRNIYPLAQGISRFNISKRGILSLTINLPNIREQINVYKVIKNIECLVTLQQQKLAKYQSIKKSLLQQMFI